MTVAAKRSGSESGWPTTVGEGTAHRIQITIPLDGQVPEFRPVRCVAGVTPNAQGKIVLSFVPVRGSVTVDAH